MSGTRIMIDLFLKDLDPADLGREFPQLHALIRSVKDRSSVINNGKSNEENTVHASYHKCHHDEDPLRPCEEETNFSLEAAHGD